MRGLQTTTLWLARCLLVAALGSVVIPGCSVPRGGLSEAAEYSCEAFVCNDEGHIERVSLGDLEFADRRVFDHCPAADLSSETMWRIHLQEVLNSGGNFRDHAGPWHVRSLNCTASDFFTEAPTCPALSAGPIDDCVTGSAACVLAAPEPRDFAPTNLSEASPAETISYENTCPDPQFIRADGTVFDDAFGQFTVTANTCRSTADPRGLELSPFGAEGDGCTVQLQFQPKDVGLQTASYRVPVDGADMITSTLRSEGVGSTPRLIDGLSALCIDPGAADCATVALGVVSDGPAGFRITSPVDYEIAAGTGFTEPPTGPAIDTVFAPGSEALYEVEWCRSRSTLPSESLALYVSTTTDEAGVTQDFEFKVSAQTPCP